MKKYLLDIYWIYRTWPMRWNFPKYKISLIEETIDDIIQNRKSISRLGDADFLLLIGARDVSYQKLSPEISAKLKEVVERRDDRIIIGLPDTLNSTRGCNRNAKIHWKLFLNTHGKKLAKYLDVNYEYGNSNITRFYIDAKDKTIVKSYFDKFKSIWQGKDIVIIEGKYSRLGVGNDLMNGAKSIKRILAPHKDAFQVYDQLKEILLEFPKKTIFIFALGPTATILCSELAVEGYWSIDVGNIDIEYMWMQMGATEKVPVKGRFSVETGNKLTTDLILDPIIYKDYFDSIIKEIE